MKYQVAILLGLLFLTKTEGSWLLDELNEKIQRAEYDYGQLVQKIQNVIQETEEKFESESKEIMKKITENFVSALNEVSSYRTACSSPAVEELYAMRESIHTCIEKVETDFKSGISAAYDLVYQLGDNVATLLKTAAECVADTTDSFFEACVVNVIEEFVSSVAKDTVAVLRFVAKEAETAASITEKLSGCAFNGNYEALILSTVKKAATCNASF